MIVDTRKKTGRGRTTWPYFDAMEELLGQDPAVHPPVIVSASVCTTASVCVSPQATTTSTMSASTRLTAGPSTMTSDAATATSSSSSRKRKQDQPPAWAERFLVMQQAYLEHKDRATEACHLYSEDTQQSWAQDTAVFAVDLQKELLLARMPDYKKCILTSRLVVFNEPFASVLPEHKNIHVTFDNFFPTTHFWKICSKMAYIVLPLFALTERIYQWLLVVHQLCFVNIDSFSDVNLLPLPWRVYGQNSTGQKATKLVVH